MSENPQDMLRLQRDALLIEPTDDERSLGYLAEVLTISLNAIRDSRTREVFCEWLHILESAKNAEFDLRTRQRRKTAA